MAISPCLLVFVNPYGAKRKFYQTEMGFMCDSEWWRAHKQKIELTAHHLIDNLSAREKRVNEHFSASTKKDAEWCGASAQHVMRVCVRGIDTFNWIDLFPNTNTWTSIAFKHYNSTAISVSNHKMVDWSNDHLPPKNHALHINLNDVFGLTLIHCMASATVSNCHNRQYSIDFVRACFRIIFLTEISESVHIYSTFAKWQCTRKIIMSSLSTVVQRKLFVCANHTNVFAFTIWFARAHTR